MLAALVTMLTAASPVSLLTDNTRLDVGGLVGAAWYVPQGRQSMMLALDNAKGHFFGSEELHFDAMVNAMPVVGPLRMATTAEGLDQAVLVTTGALQLLGTAVALERLLSGDSEEKIAGPRITLSPIVAGQLGLGLRVTHF